jgi:hypothetical protein
MKTTLWLVKLTAKRRENAERCAVDLLAKKLANF